MRVDYTLTFFAAVAVVCGEDTLDSETNNVNVNSYQSFKFGLNKNKR